MSYLPRRNGAGAEILHDRVCEAGGGDFFRLDVHAHPRFAHGARGSGADGSELNIFGELNEFSYTEETSQVVKGGRAGEDNYVDFAGADAVKNGLVGLLRRNGAIGDDVGDQAAALAQCVRDVVTGAIAARQQNFAALHRTLQLVGESVRGVIGSYVIHWKSLLFGYFRRRQAHGRGPLNNFFRTGPSQAELIETTGNKSYRILTGEQNPIEGGKFSERMVKRTGILRGLESDNRKQDNFGTKSMQLMDQGLRLFGSAGNEDALGCQRIVSRVRHS